MPRTRGVAGIDTCDSLRGLEDYRHGMLRSRAGFRNWLPLVVRLLAVCLALSCAHCSSSSSCIGEPDTDTIADGIVIGNTYISAPNDAQHRGPWAHFPPARTLVFEHHLEGVPYQIAIWLAFQPFGTLAPSTGNLSIRQLTTDDSTIAIKNDTCSEYWAWVEASLPTYPATFGEAGAPASEAADPSAGGAP